MAYTSKYTGGQIEEKLDEIFASKLQEKAVEIVDNGATEVSADEEFLGLGKVSINVAIPTEEKVVDITENGTTDVVADNGFLSKVSVNVNVPTSGGGTSIVSPKDVNFRDYDGTVLHAYTKDEFLALSELPPLPTQPGLICQEWNWDYTEAREYVSDCGVLEVGAIYITDDGKTRLYISLEYDINLSLYLTQQNAKAAIDWGDGSDIELVNSSGSTSKKHSFKKGDYCITIDSYDGAETTLGYGSQSTGIFGSTSFGYNAKCLRKVEIGKNTTLKSYVFNNCINLSSITLPNTVDFSGGYGFINCYKLQYVALPKSAKTLNYVFINAFVSCISLPPVIETSNSICDNAKALTEVSIPRVNNVGGFNGCAMSGVIIPEGVTALTFNSFASNPFLVEVHIASSCKSIGDGSFRNCGNLMIVDFSSSTEVPVNAGTNTFYGTNASTKIVVPDALYDEWIAATNWSSYASKIVKASEFNG